MRTGDAAHYATLGKPESYATELKGPDMARAAMTLTRLKLFCASVVLACAVGSIALTVPTSAQDPPAAAPTIKIRASGWIGVNWEPIAGAEYYKVQLQGTRTDGTKWKRATNTDKMYHSYGFVKRRRVPADVPQVTARVAAILHDGSRGKWSDPSPALTLPTPLWTIPPTISFTDSGMLAVHWTGEDDADRYEIWLRGTYADGTTADWKRVETTDAPATSQTLSIGTGCDVPPVDKIRARVRAIRDSGDDSLWSNKSKWETITDLVPDSSGITLRHEGSNFVVRWDAVDRVQFYFVRLWQETCSGERVGLNQPASLFPSDHTRQASFPIDWVKGVKVRAQVEVYEDTNKPGPGLIKTLVSPYLIVKK